MLHQTGIRSDLQKMAKELGSGSGLPTEGGSNYAKSRGYAAPNWHTFTLPGTATAPSAELASLANRPDSWRVALPPSS